MAQQTNALQTTEGKLQTNINSLSATITTKVRCCYLSLLHVLAELLILLQLLLLHLLLLLLLRCVVQA